MSGIIALIFLIGWGWLIKVIIKYISGLSANDVIKKTIWIIGFPLLFVSPLLDEVVAIPQVHKICREGTELHFNAEKIRGKTIRLDFDPEDVLVQGFAIPVKRIRYSYKDVGSNEELGYFDAYDIKGGWFSRTVNFNSYSGPWIVNTSNCVRSDRVGLPAIYGFVLVN